jgi:inositol transport system permease protein
MQLATTKAKASLRRNQLFLLVAVLIIATVISHGVFMRPANLMVVTASAAAFGLVSFGQALVVIGGGFDLAVGSLVAMSISAIVFFRSDFGIVGGTVAALAAVTVAGLISGMVVSQTKIPPFIVTLGMLSVADSMSWILAAGQPITVPEYNDAISPLFESLPLGENIFPIIVLVVGFVATSLLLHRSKWGRYIYAIGDNEAAARIAGVPVTRTKLLCYGLSGLCAVGAIIYLYQNISATPGEGADYLLLSFAATILGGVYMYGAREPSPASLSA